MPRNPLIKGILSSNFEFSWGSVVPCPPAVRAVAEVVGGHVVGLEDADDVRQNEDLIILLFLT